MRFFTWCHGFQLKFLHLSGLLAPFGLAPPISARFFSGLTPLAFEFAFSSARQQRFNFGVFLPLDRLPAKVNESYLPSCLCPSTTQRWLLGRGSPYLPHPRRGLDGFLPRWLSASNSDRRTHGRSHSSLCNNRGTTGRWSYGHLPVTS